MNNNIQTRTRTGAVIPFAPIGKIGQRRQVVIPKKICDDLGLQTGDFIEVTQVKRTVVIKLKKIVDADDVLIKKEEAEVRKGERQIRQGKSKFWSAIKYEMAR